MKRIKHFVRTILVLFITIFVAMIVWQLIQQSNKEKQSPRECSLSEIELNSIYDSTKTIVDPNKRTIVLNYFNTHCDFCKYEVKDIIENIELFTKTNIYFVSDQPYATLRKFSEEYKIDSFPTLHINKIDYLVFTDLFGEVAPPTTIIIDTSGKIIEEYQGQVRAPVLAKEISVFYSKD